MNVIDKILWLLPKKGIEQYELESIAGLARGRISKWKKQDCEGGRLQFQLDQALKIARALDVTLDYLADEAQEVPPPVAPVKPADGGEEKLLWLYRSLGITPEEAARRLAGEVPPKATVKVIAEQDVSGIAKAEKDKGRLGFELEGEPEPVDHKNGNPPRVEG